MPLDLHYLKHAQKSGKYKKLTPQQKKTKDLERFLDRTEFYIERCEKIEYSIECSIAESERKNREYRWYEYNQAVKSAIRIWEEYLNACSEPPINNSDPLNGLNELKKWAIKEQRSGDAETSKPEDLSMQTATTDEQDIRSNLTKAEILAYQSYEYAIQQSPELAERTDKDVYDWLKKHGMPGEEQYDLPSFETWSRYVRAGRKANNAQKNTSRNGRFVRAGNAAEDPELLKQISSQYSKPD